MYQAQQIVEGPVAPAQYGAMQVAGPAAYYPLQTDWTSLFSMMMPMIMMVVMLAIMMPMLRGVTEAAR